MRATKSRCGRDDHRLVLRFHLALFKAYEPVKRLGAIYQLFQQAVGTSTQVFSLLALPEEDHGRARMRKFCRRFSKSVEFETLASPTTRPPELESINLKAPAGAVVAIVGSSGAGKTTLVNLLPRFYAATSGCRPH